MKRGIPVVVAALLIAIAFAAGYYVRWSGPRTDARFGSQPVMAQQPTPAPRESPRSRQQGEKGQRSEVLGTIEQIRDRTLVIKVTQSRGLRLDPGGTLTAELGAGAAILREIPLSELRRGSNVSLRVISDQGKYVINQVIVEQR